MEVAHLGDLHGAPAPPCPERNLEGSPGCVRPMGQPPGVAALPVWPSACLEDLHCLVVCGCCLAESGAQPRCGHGVHGLQLVLAAAGIISSSRMSMHDLVTPALETACCWPSGPNAHLFRTDLSLKGTAGTRRCVAYMATHIAAHTQAPITFQLAYASLPCAPYPTPPPAASHSSHFTPKGH